MQPEDLRRLVGHNVRQRRRELRLTQIDLADRLKMTQPYLSEIETGQRSTTLSTLAKIAEALEVTPSYLLAGPVIAPTWTESEELGLTDIR